jgi:hypothetical protein
LPSFYWGRRCRHERASLSLSSDGNMVTELFGLERHPEGVTKYTSLSLLDLQRALFN